MANPRMRPLFLAISTLILLSVATPVMAWGWNPLFFWKKQQTLQQGEPAKPQPFLGFSRSTPRIEEPDPHSSTVLSAQGIMQKASLARNENIEKLITQRRRLNADMVVMREKQRAYGAQLAALDKDKKYVAVTNNPGATSVRDKMLAEKNMEEQTPDQPKKRIFVKPSSIFQLPKVFTNFR